MSETTEDSDFEPTSGPGENSSSDFEDEDSPLSPSVFDVDTDNSELDSGTDGSELGEFSMESDSEVMLPPRRSRLMLELSDVEDSETERLSITDDNGSSVTGDALEQDRDGDVEDGLVTSKQLLLLLLIII